MSRENLSKYQKSLIFGFIYGAQRPALCDVLACYNLARSAQTGQNMGVATLRSFSEEGERSRKVRVVRCI
jgi:hypothetical protein